jgi:hypothetical protein
MRIRRDTGPTHGPWTSKEIVHGITGLPAGLAGPRHLAWYARQHWGAEMAAQAALASAQVRPPPAALVEGDQLFLIRLDPAPARTTQARRM